MRGAHRRRVSGVIAAIVAVSIAAVGLSGSAGAAKVSGEPLKFGYIETFPGASMQPTITQAIQAYFNDWNKRGGYKGQPVDLVVETPGGFNSDAFIAAVNKLADDEKVLAIINPGSCNFTITALRSKQLPTMGASDACGPDDSSFMFNTQSRAPTLPMLTFAISQGSKAFGVAYPSAIPQLKDGFVDPLADYLSLNPEVKTKLVEVPMPFPATAADWDAAIAKMKDAGVDAFFAATQPDGGVLGLQEAEIQGFGPKDGVKWIFGPNFYDPALASQPAFEGTFSLSQAIPWEDTKNKEVKKMTKVISKHIDKRDGFAESGYQIAANLENSLKGVKGTVTPESIKAAWHKLKKQPMSLTPVKLDWTDVQKGSSWAQILVVKNGAFASTGPFIVIPAKDFTKKS